MPKKRGNRRRRKPPAEVKPKEEDPDKPTKEELRARLREKMNQKKLVRTSKHVRDKEMDDIDERLNNAFTSAREKAALRKRLRELEKAEIKNWEDSMVIGDFHDPG